MPHVDQLRHLGGLLRRYYAADFRQPLCEDLLRLASALEIQLRAIELLEVERAVAEARGKPVKLTLVYSASDANP